MWIVSSPLSPRAMIRKLRDLRAESNSHEYIIRPRALNCFSHKKNRKKIKIQSEYLPPLNIYTLKHTPRKYFLSCLCTESFPFVCLLLVFSSEAWIWHWFVNAFQQTAMASRRKNTRWGTSEKLPLGIIYLRFEITRKFTSTPSHNLLKRFDCSYITSASLFSLRLARVFVSTREERSGVPPTHQQFAQIRVDKKLRKWSSGAAPQLRLFIKRFRLLPSQRNSKLFPAWSLHLNRCQKGF